MSTDISPTDRTRDESTTSNMTPSEEVRAALADGPATSAELARQMDISPSGVRSRIAQMDDVDRDTAVGGYYIKTDPDTADGEDEDEDEDVSTTETHGEGEDGTQDRHTPVRRENIQPIPHQPDESEATDPRPDEPTTQPPVRTDRIQTSSSKQSTSRAVTEALADIERQTANLLREARENHDLAAQPQGSAGEVDVLIPRGDDHFGATGEVYDHDAEEVVEIFNLDIAKERVRQCTLEAIEKTTHLADAYDFGTCHFALLGDSVTGEDIFSSQPHEIDGVLREQIDTAAETYFEQISVLAEQFNHVHVPTVPGNHGEIRTGSASNSNNADDFVYDRVEAMVRVSDLDNVSFSRSWRTKFIDFEIRGWKVHARHGQDSLNHIGTSSGKNRWRGWLEQSNFDIGLRQHYHEKKREPVRGRPVLMSGSISPPGDFEESLSEYSPPGSMMYFIGDGDRPIEASFDIHFTE